MIPHERSLVERYQNRPFSLLGVNSDKSRQSIDNGLEKHKVNWRSFQNALPDGNQLTKQFGIQGHPTLILVDHKGIIAKIWLGSPGEKVLDEQIEELVKRAEQDKIQ